MTETLKKDLKQLLQPVRGTQDFLPAKAARVRYIEETALKVFQAYGYGEIRTPDFEFTELFARNVGEATDIVTKEMYTFNDRGGESLTLKPEGTAPVVRAYYTHGLKQSLPLKLCYVGTPVFRYERPQKGRYRQHHQIGAEFFGVKSALAEVELLDMMLAVLKALKIDKGLYVTLNSIGTSQERVAYGKALLSYLEPYKNELSKESQERLLRNPLRVLDSKSEADQRIVANAPKPLDCLGPESLEHFNMVKSGLDALGVPWKVVPTMVRGLDYYSHTVFEVHSEALGAQSQVLSGGRYNHLIEKIGGQEVPALGFGGGIERLELLMPEQPADAPPLSIIALGEEARIKALAISSDLRQKGVPTSLMLEESSFKSQMKKATKLQSAWVVILGEDELKQKSVLVKNMDAGTQELVSIAALAPYIKEKYTHI